MESVLSRILVNFSRTNVSDIFLDPFSGAASLLIEACYIGAYPVGLEINPKMIIGGYHNVRSLNCTTIQLLIGDATKMPLQDSSIDAISTDPPYGRSAGTFRRTLLELYSQFLSESARVLKTRRYLTMCYPEKMSSLPHIAENYGFKEVFRCKMRVHKALSRLISIFLLG